MDFQKLPNPSYKPLHTLPLLNNMERKYYKNAPSSPVHRNNVHPSKSFNKKQKPNHAHNHAQNLYQHPGNKNTNPRNPNTQYGGPYTTQSAPIAKPTVSPPRSTLVNPINLEKLEKMKKSVQPGMMPLIPQQGVVHGIFMAGKWDNMVFYRGQNYHIYLMGEFYANMIVQKGLDDVFLLNTVVHGKNMLVDVNTFARALKLGLQTPFQPCINIFEKFVFQKNEFELFVGFFCNSDVPVGLFEEECAIDFRHFTPIYQQVAIIIRANILPKPKEAHFFDFVDLKVMFQLVTNQVEFNICYVILLNMIYGFQEDFMPFGLLLTAIFELYHIPLPRILAERVEYLNMAGLVRNQVPLSECNPVPAVKIKLAPAVLLKIPPPQNNLENMLEIKTLNFEVKVLKDNQEKMLARLNELENRNKEDSTDGKNEGVSERISRLFDESLVDDMVDAGVQTEPLPDLTDMPEDLGFVTVEKPVET